MHDILLPNSRVKRVRNSYRYPAQAALAARLPVLGRRVPMRGYWKRQPLKPARTAERYMTSMFGGPSTLVGMCGGLFGGGVTERLERIWPAGRIRAEERGREALDAVRQYVPDHLRVPDGLHMPERPPIRVPERFDLGGLHVRKHARSEETGDNGEEGHRRLEAMRSMSMPSIQLPGLVHRHVFDGRMRALYPTLLAGAAAGALAMYYLDPNQGRRRRALVRDKMAHLRNVMTRSVPERAGKRARFFGGVAKGVGHNAMELVRTENGRYEDDETLVARVRSEVLRDPRFKPGEIHLDAYEGCVTLRGQLDQEQDIRKLVSDTKHVEGVREVRSYLHLPDAPPPNKAEVYRASEQHMPAI